MQAKTIEAPTYWASALVNGDYSGLTTEECATVRKWRKCGLLPADASFVCVSEESRFTWNFRIYGGDVDGGNVSEYTYLTKKG